MVHPVRIVVQEADFDLSAEIAALHRRSGNSSGAAVSFTGMVRDQNLATPVTALELEHYPGMTESSIAAIVDDARVRWSLDGVTVIHRIGKLSVADQIVLVAVASAHRQDAFCGCEFIMDFLKTRAPFWKKEHVGATSRWLDARQSDADAIKKWAC